MVPSLNCWSHWVFSGLSHNLRTITGGYIIAFSCTYKLSTTSSLFLHLKKLILRLKISCSTKLYKLIILCYIEIFGREHIYLSPIRYPLANPYVYTEHQHNTERYHLVTPQQHSCLGAQCTFQISSRAAIAFLVPSLLVPYTLLLWYWF